MEVFAERCDYYHHLHVEKNPTICVVMARERERGALAYIGNIGRLIRNIRINESGKRKVTRLLMLVVHACVFGSREI